MSDRRRRRRQNSGGEESDDDPEKQIAPSDPSDHEYESAAEEDEVEGEGGYESENDGSEGGGEERLYPETEGSENTKKETENGDGETEERGTGDGQEASAKTGDKVDVDEDRRNPAYIPKRGLFYEHDDRLESGEEEEGEEGEEGEPKPEKSGEKKSESGKPATEGSADKSAQKPKRVFRSDAAEKWGHDKFSEQEQAPKSSEELVSVYGYDIRNEDNAPRARRRRRYGRGPNKYTRNWEDEAAYQQKAVRPEVTGPGVKKKFENSNEAFPPLGGGEPRSGPSPRKPQREDNDHQPQQHQMQQQRGKARGRGGSHENSAPQDREWHREERGGHRGGRGRGIREPFRRGTGERVRSPGERTGSRRHDEQDVENVERELSKVNVAGNKERIGSGRVPNHDSDVSGEAKPKRYSSSRPARGQGQPRGGGGRENFYQQQEFSQDQQPKQGQQPGRSGPGSSGKSDPIQFSASQAFPNTRNCGPPPDAPFLNVTSSSAIPASGTTAPYINPAGGMINYGPPPPVPYAAVPVTVPIPLVGDNPLAMIAAAAASHLNPVQTFVPNPVSTQDPVLLAAAAAQGQGYAEVRGGVTYFHPQASASVRGPAQVSKRPKAAIPIVDPSKVADQGGKGVHQNGDAKQSEDAQLATAPANAEAATA